MRVTTRFQSDIFITNLVFRVLLFNPVKIVTKAIMYSREARKGRNIEFLIKPYLIKLKRVNTKFYERTKTETDDVYVDYAKSF